MEGSSPIVQGLQERLYALEAERDSRIEAIHREYDPQIAQVKESIRGFEPRLAEDRPTALSVGEDRLKFVREYFRAHASEKVIRQAEIAAALEVKFHISANSASGAASTGCRRLEIEGLIEAAPKLRGSNAWRIRAPLAEAA